MPVKCQLNHVAMLNLNLGCLWNEEQKEERESFVIHDPCVSHCALRTCLVVRFFIYHYLFLLSA